MLPAGWWRAAGWLLLLRCRRLLALALRMALASACQLAAAAAGCCRRPPLSPGQQARGQPERSWLVLLGGPVHGNQHQFLDATCNGNQHQFWNVFRNHSSHLMHLPQQIVEYEYRAAGPRTAVHRSTAAALPRRPRGTAALLCSAAACSCCCAARQSRRHPGIRSRIARCRPGMP